MSIEAQIQEQIANNPILLYMKGTPDFPQCGFSGQAVQILRALGVQEFAHVNVLANPEIRATLPKIANWPTFPQLYIKGELVGGSDIMMELYQSGELKKLLDF
jgi:monothiol glutaredoxin